MNLQYNFRIKHPIREEQENIVMKKLIAIALTAVMLLGLLAGCGNSGSDDSGLKTVESGKLIMSTNAAFPPYEMTTDDGGFAGIDVEIAQAIADKLGLELEIDDMDFDAALLAVQQGKSDIVMAGVSVTEKRLLVMDFSDSYATGVQVVIVKEGSDVTMDNLGEKMIGTSVAPPATCTHPIPPRTAATARIMSPLTRTA